MTLSAGNNLQVEYLRIREAGSPWIVRVYRKSIFGRRLLTSDWFLDAEQAKRFAETLAADLRAGATLDAVRSRAPGWTLHRP